jgi:hypothetical protein
MPPDPMPPDPNQAGTPDSPSLVDLLDRLDHLYRQEEEAERRLRDFRRERKELAAEAVTRLVAERGFEALVVHGFSWRAHRDGKGIERCPASAPGPTTPHPPSESSR